MQQRFVAMCTLDARGTQVGGGAGR
jgi:hypothetical protein